MSDIQNKTMTLEAVTIRCCCGMKVYVFLNSDKICHCSARLRVEEKNGKYIPHAIYAQYKSRKEMDQSGLGYKYKKPKIIDWFWK